MEQTAVFVVMGSSGEYSDHCEWLVGYYTTQKEAETCVEVLSALSREAQKIYERYTSSDIDWEEQDRKIQNLMRPFDPTFNSSYAGTNYYCVEVKPGKDFSKVELTEEKIQMLQNVNKESI